MLEKIIYNKLLAIGIHILIGYLATFAFFPKPFGVAILLIGFIIVSMSNNNNEEAFKIASYVAGAEVFLRMVKGVISYEMGKYGVLFFLLIGMFIGPIKQKISVIFFVYILLLLLGIVFTAVPEGESLRKAIIFNLSGPIVLGVSALYFYKRMVTKKQLLDALFLLLLPVFSMVTYMYFRTPNLRELVFNTSSNAYTSGGFGPNQVATALGVGIFIIGVFLLLKEKLSGYVVLDALFLAYFTYRGLLTFSRGGVITGGVAFIVFAFFMLLHQGAGIKNMIKYIFVAGVFVLGVFLYTSDVTGGMLENRYAGKNARGEKKKDVSAGRGKIFKMQLESFYESPLVGIGVGNGKYKRQLSDKHVTAVSHNEVSRLIEEHGFIGILMLIMLITIPLSHFSKMARYQKAFLISFYLLWFLTINHSAMRIAFPGFIYGWSLINIIDEED